MSHHLAIFLPSLSGGGAELIMLALAKAFVTRGVRCDLVIAMHKGELINDVPEGVQLISLHRNKTIHAVFALSGYLRRERPEALLTTTLKASIAALLAKRLTSTGTRMVLCEANPIAFAMQSSNLWKTTVNKVAVHLLYRKADDVILISEGVHQSLLNERVVDPSRMHIIYNPIPRDCARHSKNSANGQFSLVACGRLHPQKDHATLLRVLAKLRHRFAVHLTIVGEGPLRGELEAQARTLGISDAVTFTGFVTDPTKYFAAADVFVHTSRYEGFGVVLLEALACGCAIVATDCPGGVQEVLANGKFGTLVPVGDDEAIANAVAGILGGEVEFPDASEYLQQFDINRIAEAYLAVLFPQDEAFRPLI